MSTLTPSFLMRKLCCRSYSKQLLIINYADLTVRTCTNSSLSFPALQSLKHFMDTDALHIILLQNSSIMGIREVVVSFASSSEFTIAIDEVLTHVKTGTIFFFLATALVVVEFTDVW